MSRGHKRKIPSPWERELHEACYTAEINDYVDNYAWKWPKFHRYQQNMYLDIDTKRAATIVSESVVSLVAYSGDEQILETSGTVIESNDTTSVVLTSADLIRSPADRNSILDALTIVVYLWDGKFYEGQVLAVDFHYNIAAVEVRPGSPLQATSLWHLDDSLTVDPTLVSEETPFQLRPHSHLYNIIPGDKIIAVGRHFVKPQDLMAAPGEFSMDRCERDCKELLRANCNITGCGVGGPLINYHGEVIGICFTDFSHTPFLPINLASKWWYHYKKSGEIHRPWLAMELTNLFAAKIHIVEKIIRKFPNTFKGVIVEEVVPGSYVHSAGIQPNDVIVQFDGKTIHSFLQLVETMWDKVGKPVEVVVVRASDGMRLPLSMVVDEATPEKFYSWPCLEHYG